MTSATTMQNGVGLGVGLGEGCGVGAGDVVGVAAGETAGGGVGCGDGVNTSPYGVREGNGAAVGVEMLEVADAAGDVDETGEDCEVVDDGECVTDEATGVTGVERAGVET